ncbi:MAG: hypothetical protein CMI35_04425 [Owenweeksia sp.]|nr:hypothetical protein [Owenweeksia sp.]|tara:strand:- start:10930 stop:12783 length:1854 start_codon:yes stop_codon:yes gene_type:complete
MCNFPFALPASGLRWAVLFSLFTFWGNAQILEHLPEAVWLKQTDSAYSSTQHLSRYYIGNHPVLDFAADEDHPKLEHIASQSSGTLFVVLRGNPLFDAGEKLLQLGRVALYPHKAILDGREMEIDTIGEEATLLRFTFQGRADHRHRPATVQLGEHTRIAEIIFYDQLLEKEAARIVESYLALKYSINITENTDPELRDYLDIFSDKAWNWKLDRLYNEEVLALGRIDRIGFKQSQTYTSDGKSLSISLDSNAIVGDMPAVSMQDGSMIILSKKDQELSTPECGGSPMINGWKIRLMNWSSPADKIYLTLDTLLDSNQQALLTNGIYEYPVQTTLLNGQTRLAIPITVLDTPEDLYLAWEASSRECDPLAESELLTCSRLDSSFNHLFVKLQPEALPAQLHLANLQTGQVLQTYLTEPMSQVRSLNKGQYQLTLSQENRILLDELFVLENCRENLTDLTLSGNILYEEAGDGDEQTTNTGPQGESGNTSGHASWAFSVLPGNGPLNMDEQSLEAYLHSLGLNTQDFTTIESRGVSIYPNPGNRYEAVNFRFIGLGDIPFTIQIFDSKGNLMSTEAFRPEGNVDEYHYHFRVDGSYFIRFNSATYSETQQLRIKSNLR